jgi:signal transduction histidine kinase
MAIIGSVELGLDDEDDIDQQERRDRLQNILCAAKRIKQLNQHIMGLGRIMAEQPVPVNLLELFEQCMKMYGDLLKKDKVAVTLETDGQTYVANVSSFGLEQVFKNLILNAVEAMQDRGTKQIGIAFGRNPKKREIEISIEDTGVGIEHARLSKVFAPYYTSKPEGNGIGLAVVRNVIEQYKGRIQVKSRPGEGTRFLVSLPAL